MSTLRYLFLLCLVANFVGSMGLEPTPYQENVAASEREEVSRLRISIWGGDLWQQTMVATATPSLNGKAFQLTATRTSRTGERFQRVLSELV
jgi:hypothetical protein